jgi:anti-sigma regulatory factor (Ser/Thr protein kinase)
VTTAPPARRVEITREDGRWVAREHDGTLTGEGRSKTELVRVITERIRSTGEVAIVRIFAAKGMFLEQRLYPRSGRSERTSLRVHARTVEVAYDSPRCRASGTGRHWFVDSLGEIADLALLPSDGAPGHARDWVRDLLDELGASEDVRYAVTLVVDELVTNAAIHAATRMQVTVGRKQDLYRCVVRDESTDGPYPRIIETADGYGRGLRVVALLSQSWGVERDSNGTSVWAEIDGH